MQAIRLIRVALAGGALLAATAATSQAAPDLIKNGNFETTTATQSTQINTTNVSNWSTTGYAFIFLPNAAATSGTQADTTGATNGLKLWGPGDGSNNNLTTSPAGKTFIGSDNNYQSAAISQSVTGLTAGTTYALGFWWAAAQQYGYDGATQEQWTVTFGNSTQATSVYNLASHGFSGWMYQTMYFTATSATQTLSFLASGTPGGQPPFSLLDGVTLTAAPEPATWAILLAGLTGLAAVARRRRSRLGGSM